MFTGLSTSATEHMLSPAQTVCLHQTTPPPLPLSPIMFYKCLERHLAVSPVRCAQLIVLIDVLIAARCCSNKTSIELLPPRRAGPLRFAARYDRRIANLLWPALDLSRSAVSWRPDRIVIYVLGWVGGCRRFNGGNIALRDKLRVRWRN